MMQLRKFVTYAARIKHQALQNAVRFFSITAAEKR